MWVELVNVFVHVVFDLLAENSLFFHFQGTISMIILYLYYDVQDYDIQSINQGLRV